MKSRVTIMIVTGLALAGMVGACFLAQAVQQRKAIAQRVPVDSSRPTALQPNVAIPAHAPPGVGPYRPLNAYGPSGATEPAPLVRGQPNVSHHDLTAASPQPVIVSVKDGPQLSGEPIGLHAIEFKTVFGPVSVPLYTISGLRMADEPGQPTTICLANGDSLTGELLTEAITIKTQWGGATIGRDHIVSIVTVFEPVIWRQGEGRWTLEVADSEGADSEGDESEEAGPAGDSEADPERQGDEAAVPPSVIPGGTPIQLAEPSTFDNG